MREIEKENLVQMLLNQIKYHLLCQLERQMVLILLVKSILRPGRTPVLASVPEVNKDVELVLTGNGSVCPQRVCEGLETVVVLENENY